MQIVFSFNDVLKHTTGETMKSAVVVFFDEGGAPVEYKLACHKQQESKLREIARLMFQAAVEGPHVCKCGGGCNHKEKGQLK